MTVTGHLSTLPPLAPDEARHCARVLEAVRARIIEHGGWLSFEDYLRMVLYAPGLGYYSAGSVKLGRAGDFITAPELSGLFAGCLARQCAEVLERTGGELLELGAGTGSLAAGLLPALQALGTLPERYRILEVSADLAERQRTRLASLPPDLARRVQWCSSLPETPLRGVVLANEVADALPFRRFVVASDAYLERGVALDAQGALRLADRPADAALAAELARIAAGMPEQLRGWPEGYCSELCLLVEPWLASLAAPLASGVLLILDYGLPRHELYHPQRLEGTLRCHFRHRAHDDALLYPGLQDISAWVDFTRVAEAGSAAGLRVQGYATQAAFLLATGIEADIAAAADPLQRARLASEARQLLLPGEMGETFKVMALVRDWRGPLCGFAHQDLRRML